MVKCDARCIGRIAARRAPTLFSLGFCLDIEIGNQSDKYTTWFYTFEKVKTHEIE